MFTNLLNKTANIQAKTYTQQASGEKTEGWATILTLPTRYTRSKNTRVLDDKYVVNTDEFIFFFDNNTITRANRIEVDGKTFEINSVYEMDGYADAHHMEVYATLIDHD